MLGWLLKKKMRRITEQYDSKLDKVYSELEKVRVEAERSSGFIDIGNRVFKLFPSAQIVGIEENKYEKLFVVRKVKESSIEFNLMGVSYPGISNLPRIYASIFRSSTESKLFILIDDIQNEDDCIGNGSILMRYLIREAQSLSAQHIEGRLSHIDADHFDRSEHFYKKFEFDVEFDEKRKSGKIKRIL